jgi:hypothetical protein
MLWPGVLMCPSWLLHVALAAGPSCPDAAAQAAKNHYASADYAGAISALTNLELCPDGTDVELAEALRWRAQAKTAAGDTAGALDAWSLLATVKPGYALDALESPKFHAQFAQGKARAERGRLVFARLVRTLGTIVFVQVFDPRNVVKRVALKLDKREIAAAKQSDGLYAATVPEAADAASVVVESSEAVVFRTPKVMLTELPGAPAAPVEAVIVKPPRPAPAQPSEGPSTTTWLIIGGSVVAAAIIAGIATGVAVGSSKKIDGSLGSVQLPLTGAP